MDGDTKKTDLALREEETQAFWEREGIFEKTLEHTKGKEDFVFYDGPPFATGLPHYGHMLASTIKDTIPRYQTMRGRYVRRVWGWDCHGLPIENLIETELGLGHKKDIEAYGIENFNEAARASVLRYDAEWKKMIPRLGRWIDMERAYKTMDASYTESIWWAFKELYQKDLVYRGFKPMHVCPRCETTLSNNEVSEGYKDVTDISVTAKFALCDEADTFVLAWTTTPWTLPGNVALAVSAEAQYAKVRVGSEMYILAVERIAHVLKDKEHEVLDTFLGSTLVGKSYLPVFDYYHKDLTISHHEHGWKIYAGDFVTMDTGTGVVHIAPAFGEDDMNLGKMYELPFIQHVGMDGVMRAEVSDFAGVRVKEKGDTQSADILVIKYLAAKGTLFSKEKIIHAYPHCWRCDTPLLNYAAESWFVKSSALREKLLKYNQTTEWTPSHIRDGRFGKWLENARDWAISRSRYWGAPIPVWHCASCKTEVVLGSREELATHTKKSGNTYIIMRHAQAESNVKHVVSSNREESEAFGLTEDGRKHAHAQGETLRARQIDVILASPFARTRQTAEIVAGEVGIEAEHIIYDDRLREIDGGTFNGGPVSAYRDYFSSLHEKFEKRPDQGENLLDVKRRVMTLFEELEERYQGKTILLVTHGDPSWMLTLGTQGGTIDDGVALRAEAEYFIDTGEVRDLPFVRFPHDAEFQFDVHVPYIDRVPLVCSCGGTLTRVPYVFDCWFESGSMPYAQLHYPFENKDLFERNFPAHFIAEGIDQTRGWFYNMLVLSTGLFDRAPFRHVVVNGLVLAEDGRKMSKKLKNYPDPWHIMNTYGADATRYYLLASPAVYAEDLAFSEKGVDEVVKKHIARTLNVLSFYELYRGEGAVPEEKSPHILDQWILARLAELEETMREAFDRYALDRAAKPVALFVDDLSTWYLRRSRDRFKSDDALDRGHAIGTTRTVLLEFSKLLAPVMPFLAEHLYQHVGGKKESVHLETWPVLGGVDQDILAHMAETRRVVSLALEARTTAGIKVRQPLASLTVQKGTLEGKNEYLELIKDEANIKSISFEESLPSEVSLDTVITEELKKEGQLRELMRAVQDLRKQAGLLPGEEAVLHIEISDEGKEWLSSVTPELSRATILRDVLVTSVSGDALDLGGIKVTIAIFR